MDVINNIHNKLTYKSVIPPFPRKWKHKLGDSSAHLKDPSLTQKEKDFIESSESEYPNSLCSMVIQHGPTKGNLATKIYQHIYNESSGTSAVNRCRSQLYPDNNEDESDEEDARNDQFRRIRRNSSRTGGRRRRRRKSRRKKKSRKSKRRKGLNSKKRRRRKRRTKKR